MLLIAAVTAAIAAARHPTATKAGEAGRFRVVAVAAAKAAARRGAGSRRKTSRATLTAENALT